MKNSTIGSEPEQTVAQLKNELRACIERYHLLMENIQDGIVTFDTAGRFTFVNEVIVKRSGQPPEWFYDRTYLEVIREKDRELAKTNFAKTLDGKKTPVYEFAYPTASGELQWIETNVTPLFENGRVVGVFGVSRDINQRKKVETNLRKSEAMLHAIIGSLPFDVFALDMNNQYILQNPTCKKNWGNIIGKAPEDIPIAPKTKDLWTENNRRALSGETVTAEVSFETSSGSRNTYYNVIAPILDRETILGIVGVNIDISERKRFERDLKKALAETERQVQERTRELQLKSHKLEEINTALNLLLEKRSEDNRAIEERVMISVKKLVFPYLKKLKKNLRDDTSKILIGIVESNLNEVLSPFAREISSGYFSLTPSEIKVADLVRQGKKTKEIAALLDISHKTIERHRENIRKKMGLKNKKIHLQSYLSSLR